MAGNAVDLTALGEEGELLGLAGDGSELDVDLWLRRGRLRGARRGPGRGNPAEPSAPAGAAPSGAAITLGQRERRRLQGLERGFRRGHASSTGLDEPGNDERRRDATAGV